jgi:hypothetical protein
MISPTEVKMPNDKKNLYIPLMTNDGVNWTALEPSFVLPAAKSRLRSALPDVWQQMAVPDKYRDVRCGLAIVKLQDIESSAYFLEFTPDDFLNDKITSDG